MARKEFTTMVLIFFLSLWGALYLESGLAEYFVLELFIILILVISAAGILYGLALEKDWAWASVSVFFIASLANCIFVYIFAGNTTPFVVLSAINILGVWAGATKIGINLQDSRIPELPPMPEAYDSVPEERIYRIDESDLVSHIDVDEYDDLGNLETFEIEPEKAIAPARKSGSSAGKRKLSKKKKR